jgi:hypothetical protein
MAIVLNDITSGYNLSKINANFQNIEDYINDKLLARADTGVAGGAMMERSLDMNGNEILNYPVDVTNPNSLVTKAYVDAGDAALSLKIDTEVSKTLRFPEAVPVMSQSGARANSLQGYNNLGYPIPVFSMTATADLAIKLASTEDGLGDALIGMKQPLTQAVSRTQHDKNTETVSVEDFGAIANGGTADAHTNSYAFQKALTAIYNRGGGKVVLKGGTYYLDYPIYLRSNTELDLCGSTVVFLDPVFNKGRGGIVVGSSYEANRDKALSNYADGSYPTSSTINTSYVNPALKQYLRDNQSFLEAENCRVHNGKLIAQRTATTGTGGYGVNFVNAQNSFAYDLYFEGWTQAIGMGSDGTPETPSNHDCHAYNLTVNGGDVSTTYYSIGFISNSTACSITNSTHVKALPTGSNNGSAVATNYVEDCYFDNINIINLGRTVSSEGLLLNNAKGTKASRITVYNAISAVSTFYTDTSFNDSAKPNHISDVYANGCDYALSLRGKYAIVDNVTSANVIAEVYFGNNNATNNTLKFTPASMAFGGTTFPANFLTANTVKGWRYQYAYLRPTKMLVNDRVDTTTTAGSKAVATAAGKNLVFSYELPSYMKAVNDIRMFLTFNTGSLTAGSVMTISLRRMVAFDGNVTETPYVEMTNSRSSTSDTLVDTSLVAQVSGTTPGWVLAEDTTHGLANSWQLYITANNNVINNYIKEARIGFWGE